MNSDEKLKQLGVYNVLVSEARRELSTQLVYWMRGRSIDFADVQAAYFKTLGWKPSPSECMMKNTWTLESKHLIGMAVDLCPTKDGKNLWWGAPAGVWARMGEIGKACGLKWGGDWKDKLDTPHFEL